MTLFFFSMSTRIDGVLAHSCAVELTLISIDGAYAVNGSKVVAEEDSISIECFDDCCCLLLLLLLPILMLMAVANDGSHTCTINYECP